ncbi:MAG: shikimate dehydrogenase [Clostridia bacterium]|nr:shikimate dehydrogenase [Clostridia bacterium]
MKDKILRLGLIGKDVSKSVSGKNHAFILKQMGYEVEYESISTSMDGFDSAIRHLLGDFDGFNITIPYKRDVFAYLDGIEGDALLCGAVNTVINKTRIGYNTDVAGFLLMLRLSGMEVKNKKILVLGAGGAGRSTAVALKGAGADVYIYQRNQEKLQEVCNELSLQAASDPESGGYDILINCTGVGMHDSEGKSPVTKAAFRGAEGAIDLIYRPAESEFLRLAKEEGLPTLNGAPMLFYQAYYADCLYLEREADDKEAERFYQNYLTFLEEDKKETGR